MELLHVSWLAKHDDRHLAVLSSTPHSFALLRTASYATGFIDQTETKEEDSILILMVLEWDVQQAHIDVMVRCPHPFGHIGNKA